MRRRIRWRITIPYIILLFAVVIVFSLLMVNLIRQREEIFWRAQLADTAQFIASEAQQHYGSQGEADKLSDLANNISENLGLVVTFLDLDGNILASTIPVEQQALSPEDLLAAVVTVQGESQETLGIVQIQTAKSHLQMGLGQIFWLSLAVIMMGIVGVLIFSLILHDQSLKPIEKLTIAAHQISMGNFTNLEFPAEVQELTDLSQALQVMAHKLGEQINRLTSESDKLNAVLNQMTDGVLIIDGDGRVQLLNPAAERLFQVDEHIGLGRSVVEVLRYHQLVDLWRKAKDGERQSTMMEIGPQHLFLQVIGIPLKTSLPGSTMILFQDLTQLRRLETVRRDFISNVSHELRTPLASLKALAETLQEGALEDTTVARRFILRMETEIDNLTQLVNELLELSRIESGKVPLSFHRIQPCDLIRPASERMELQAERAGLELVFDCQPALPAVFADPDRITQVLINLIHNAIKFTPPGGKITLSAYRDADLIVFFVKDTGVGIVRKDLGRIFERFYKADRARVGGGTGLGLSIARHMIESHGGNIWAEGEEGVGSTLYFTLPVA